MAETSTKELKNYFVTTASICGIGLVYVTLKYRGQIMRMVKNIVEFKNPLRHKQIRIVETLDECQQVVQILKSHCASYKVIGFDCEWVTVGGSRRPTALLQLATHEGLCALFRLCILQQIPSSLRELLEDDDIIKVGVGPQDDAKNLAHDFGVGVATTLDLRYVTQLAGYKSGGLAKLSLAHLNVHLDKNWRIACSNWEAKVLSDKQIQYAANDALVAIEIFKKLNNEIAPRKFWQFSKADGAGIVEDIQMFFDMRFKESFVTNLTASELQKKGISVKKDGLKPGTRRYCLQSNVVYENIFLQAPDGELLCTLDRRKCDWYLRQNLAEVVNKDPYTVRLNFEPAGRAVGEAGRYYQQPKINQCVVCGLQDVYIRKNVIPREYRKHFPDALKSHTSHDVLLLCPGCHQLSNISDVSVRIKLGNMCGAPVGNDEAAKFLHVPELKQCKSAARALVHYGDGIPDDRRQELESIIRNYHEEDIELNLEVLTTLANMKTEIDNEAYTQHGAQVVKKFQTEFGGLTELEKLWREHFLQSMRPRFMPPLWNVNHNVDRLGARANEGRIDKETMVAAGLGDFLIKEAASLPQVEKEKSD